MVLEKVNGFCETELQNQLDMLYKSRGCEVQPKENILFSGKMDVERYNEVIKACALEDDLNSFEHGDLTIIGEKGINLRWTKGIALARACYQKAIFSYWMIH